MRAFASFVKSQLALFLLGAAILLFTGGARAETINQALASAYNNNPTLNAQRAATRAADENIALAKSGYRPTITADANIGLAHTKRISLLFSQCQVSTPEKKENSVTLRERAKNIRSLL